MQSNSVCDYCKHNYSDICFKCTYEFFQFVGIEVEPVRHGKWIEVKRQDGTIVFQCPNCKDVAYTKNPYCRICGTKMDGDE